MVLRRCRLLLRDESAASDVMHDVFVELLRRRYRAESRGLASLLLTIATHRCLNRLRWQGRRPEAYRPDLLFEIACLDSLEERTLARGLLDRIFRRHPTDTRLIATLYYVDGLTLEEVARETGRSVSGVRKRLRALRCDRPRAVPSWTEGGAALKAPLPG